jgi:hypothetical protein
MFQEEHGKIGKSHEITMTWPDAASGCGIFKILLLFLVLVIINSTTTIIIINAIITIAIISTVITITRRWL